MVRVPTYAPAATEAGTRTSIDGCTEKAPWPNPGRAEHKLEGVSLSRVTGVPPDENNRPDPADTPAGSPSGRPSASESAGGQPPAAVGGPLVSDVWVY